MKNKIAPEYFDNKESNSNELKVTKETDYIEIREKKKNQPFLGVKKAKVILPCLLGYHS